MIKYEFTVPGKGVPKQRPRLWRGRAITPAKTLAYEAHVLKCAAPVVHTKLMSPELWIQVDVYVKNKVHGDIDNYIKSVQDGLNGFAYHDDKQIKHVVGNLYFDKNERVEITLMGEF